MKKLLLFLVAMVVIAAGVYYYAGPLNELAPIASLPEPDAATQPATTPQIRYPLPAAPVAPEPGAQTSDEAKAAVAVPAPLPSLDESDEAVRRVLAGLLDAQALERLTADNIVRRLAVSIDNLPGEQVPAKFRAIPRVPGEFLATGEDGEATISPDNYARYLPYVDWVTAVDSDAAVAAYVRLYPLFQKAFAELGYPKDYFNDRLVAVIDNLLATPEVEGPVELRRPSVMYKFADPELEALPAGQKMLIRMGPDNAARIQAKLRELRAALMEQVKHSNG